MTGPWRVRLLAAVAAVAGLATVGRVVAHEMSATQPKVQNVPINWEVFPTIPTGTPNAGWDQTDYHAELDESMLWWQWIDISDMPAARGGDSLVACPAGGDNTWAIGVCTGSSPGVIAWATPRWTPGGEIFECDFQWHDPWVNGSPGPEVTLQESDNSIRAVAAHELGHCWGFAHPFDGIGPGGFNGDYQSVMNYATPPTFPGLNKFGIDNHYDDRAFHDEDDAVGKYPCANPGGCIPGGGGGPPPGPPPGTPIARILAGPAVSGNAPLTVDFDASTSSDEDGTIVLYQWDFDLGGGPTVTDQPLAQVTFDLNCTPAQMDEKGNCFYTVQLVVIDDDQNFSPPATTIIQARNPLANIDPVPLFTLTCVNNCNPVNNVPDPINKGNGLGNSADDQVTFLFDATGSFDEDGQIVDYLWDFGDGGSSPQPVSQHDFTVGGIYAIILEVTDNDGDTGDNRDQPPRLIVPSHPLPLITNFPAGPIVGSAPIKHDGAASFDEDGNIITYYWQFSDGSEGFKAVWTKTFAYDVSLDNDWGPDGLFGDGVIPLDPQDNSDPNFQDADVDTYDDDFDNVDFDAVVDEITFRSILTVTDDEGLQNSVDRFITVENAATSSIDLAIDGTPNPVPAGDPVDFLVTLATVGQAVNYVWDYGDGNTLSGTIGDANWLAGIGGTLEHVFSAGGLYAASLSLKDAEGVVIATAADVISVTPSGTKVTWAGVPPPPVAAAPGDEVVVLWFILNEASPVTFPVLVQETNGDGLANIDKVTSVAIYRDINGNGLLDDPGDIFLGSAPFVGGQASLSAPASPLGAMFLVTYRFAP